MGGTVLDLVVTVKDGSTYTSSDTSSNGLYGTGKTAAINVQDNTTVTVSVALEVASGTFDFTGQWYITIYDFDTQKAATRACLGRGDAAATIRIVLGPHAATIRAPVAATPRRRLG